MSVLSVQAVAKRFGERLVFSEVSFRLAHGDRVGLVGPNGVGKTTLLRVAAGFESADAGNVAIARGTRIGFMEQEILFATAGTVEQHARGAAAHLRELEAEMHEIEPRLGTGDQELLERYSEAQHQFEHAGGYDFEATVGRVLGGLGLDALRDREVATLSGGERTRVGLARLLLDDPDILLLDEPTNHLDVAALEWLERFLVEQQETVLVSSHDRWFLDRVTSRTLSFEKGTVVEYRGGYSSYARQRAEREAATAKAATKQAEEIERTEEFIRRYGAGQRSKEARGRGKKLARVERIAAPERVQQHGWKLEAAHLAGDTVVQTTPLAVGYSAPLVRTGMLRVSRDARIAVVGPNGAGKTTLVRTLVGDLAALEGYVQSAPTARVGFLAQAQLELGGEESVLDAMKIASGMNDAEARGHLARFLFRGEDVFKSVGVLSGGERSRLALARLAARHANLLVLDEPTNHLDLLAREQLEVVLQNFEGALLFVSHDRYFIDKLATRVFEVADGAVHVFPGNYEDYRWRRENSEISPSAARKAEAPVNPFFPAEKGGALPVPADRESKRLNPIKLRQMQERCKEVEEEIEELESAIADGETALLTFVSAEETARLSRDLNANRAALDQLLKEWEEVSQLIAAQA